MDFRVGRLCITGALLGLAAWLGAGCYTTLRHPVLRPSLEGDDRMTVHFGDDCWTCHSSRSEVFWMEWAPPATRGYYAWDFYYTSPWWLDEFYYQSRHAGPVGEGQLPRPRDFRRRGEPVSPPGTPAVQQPASPPIPAVARKAGQPDQSSGSSKGSEAKDNRRSIRRRGQGQSDSGSRDEKKKRRKPKS